MTTVVSISSRDTVRRIAEAAALAPSAENLQPWKFRLEDESLVILLDTSRHLPSDIDHMLGLTAIGTCIENAVIAATAIRLQTEVEFLAKSLPMSGSACVPIARLDFSGGADRDELATFIHSRCTSRRMGPGPQLTAATLKELAANCRATSGVAVHWVNDEQLKPFAELVGLGNRIRFEHKPFHEELYDNMRFTHAEAQRTGDGLDAATLQLPVGVARIMRALRTWRRMKWANAIGFSRGVARQAAGEVIRSGAVGFISVSGSELQQFAKGGRVLERLWLTATKLGLAFHPMAGLAVFLAHARTGGHQLLPKHRRLVASMSDRFYRLFPSLDGETIQIAFRIGHGPQPPVRTVRRPLSAVLDLN
jgi:hypothetical protein